MSKLNKVISLVNQKGGVAKSTTSINLSMGLALRGFDVLLIDGDIQCTSLDWASVRETSGLESLFTVISVPKNNLAKEVSKLKTKYDFVIIDSAGRQSELSRLAIVACDIAIIPNSSSPFDDWATQATIRDINEISSYRDFSAYFLLTGMQKNTKVFDEVSSWLKGNGSDIPFIDTSIALRTAYARSGGNGQTIYDFKDDQGRKNTKGIEEMNALIDEIFEKEKITV